MYKYVTWSEGKYFSGGKLLPMATVSRLVGSISKTKKDLFTTVQDSPSLYDAYNDAIGLSNALECELGVKAFAFFSGSKGFHIMVPLYVRHKRCHEIVKLIAEDICPQVTVDPKVYRTRSMWRVNNSWNIKGERYKIAVSLTEPLDQIIEAAERGRLNSEWKAKWMSALGEFPVSQYEDKLPVFKPSNPNENTHFWRDMMPCLAKLWRADAPPEGGRHELAYMFIRHCYKSGLDRDEAASYFSVHPFWKNVDENDYTKIIRSVYTTGNAAMGCKHNEMLQSNCIKYCRYNIGNFNLADLLGG